MILIPALLGLLMGSQPADLPDYDEALQICARYAHRATPEEQELILDALDARTAPSVTAGLFDKQLALFREPSKRITAVCGRRGGKTTTMGRLIAKTMQDNPAEGEDESLVVFAAPTKNQARRLMWGRLQAIAEKFRIPMTFSATQLIARHENGSQCWIMGLDDFRDIERLRGFAFRLICVDESQSLAVDVQELVDDIIDPALADYDGRLIFTGTPNAACRGYFYNASTGQLPGGASKNWSNHHWTILDNPMFPRWRNRSDWREKSAAWLESYREAKGWSEDNASYLREWMARWIKDTGSLIFRYDASKNGFRDLPSGGGWRHVVGVDLGYNDAFAYVVLAFSDSRAEVYAVDEYDQPGLIPAQWAERLQAVVRRYNPDKIMVDTGGMGRAVLEEFRSRYHLPVHAAEKKDKLDFIAHQNSDFHERRIFVRPDSQLARSYELLQWDDDRRREDKRMHHLTNLTDACLYGWREAKHWTYIPAEVMPEIGSPEYADRQVDKMRRQRVAQLRQKKTNVLGN